MRLAFTALAGTALLLTLAACSSSPDAAAPGASVDRDFGGPAAEKALTELYETAQETGETTVTVYGTVGADREVIFTEFQERFPEIDVQLEYIIGSDLFTRVNQEVASGKPVADVTLSSQSSSASLLAADRYQSFTPVTTEGMDAEYIIDDGMLTALAGTPFGVAVNTDQIDVADAPSSWDDLLDAEYRGQLTWDNSTTPGPSSTVFAHLLNAGQIDEAWLQKYKKQDVNVATAQAMGTPLATGERAIIPSYPYDFYLADKEKGVPIDFALLDDANYVAVSYAGLLKDAPHPDAAKLLMTWLYTPDGSQVMADIGQYTFIPEGPGPEGLPALSEIDRFEPIPFEDYSSVMKSSIETLNRVLG